MTTSMQRGDFLTKSFDAETALSIRQAGLEQARAAEIAKTGLYEAAGIGQFATQAMAGYVQGTESIHQRLTAAGCRTPVYQRTVDEITLGTGDSLAKIAIFGQHEVLRHVVLGSRH